MHPFLDGNGRTARALEALLLGRAGLRETAFIAMSNYYHDEKTAYLAALARVRRQDHDLTDFIVLGLKGIAIQGQRLLDAIRRETSRELFRSPAIEPVQPPDEPAKACARPATVDAPATSSCE
jgi:Fic family protein